MPKIIRFTELVKKSGKPQTVALWTKPKNNPSFLKAIRENRVLTVIQKPTGTQKNFAMIGFAPERFALYMVFPKPLPKVSEARVVGINYQWVVEVPASQSGVETTLQKGNCRAGVYASADSQGKTVSQAISRDGCPECDPGSKFNG